jgi:Tol biopolymer transport system component
MDTSSRASRSYDSPMPARPIQAVAASPDGRHIVFQVQNDGAWLMNLHDGSVRRVLEDPTVERLAWSPSGRRVAYYSRRSGHWGVWVMVPPAQ